MTVLAGCIGGEDADPIATPAETKAPEVKTTAETGSIKGKIVTKDLEEVAKASVGVVGTDGEILTTTETDKSGQFTINGLKPGQYKLQVTAICCRAVVKTVDVKANAVTDANFQLDKLTKDDLQEPYVRTTEWHGFISCGVGAGVPDVRNPKVAVCAIPGIFDESLADPNEDFLEEFNVSTGLKSLVIGMDWKPVGGVSGGNLNLLVENEDCGGVSCSYRYADLDGAPALIVRIDNDDITDEAHLWDKIEGERVLQYRVFAGDGYANLIYQQPFTVYTHAFYWEEAPEDFSPVPDA